MQEGADLTGHINVFNQVLADLGWLDSKMEDEDVVLLLLALLPQSYAILSTTLTNGKTIVVASEITTTLLSYNQRERKSTAEGAGSRQGVGLATRYTQGGRKEKDKPRKKKGPQWFRCKNFGHIRKECLEWKKGNGSSCLRKVW